MERLGEKIDRRDRDDVERLKLAEDGQVAGERGRVARDVGDGACGALADGLDDRALKTGAGRVDDDEIDAYVATGEPMDKAGAYGIQGKGRLLVRGIEGDFYTVMGLPISRLYRELRALKA